MLAPPCVIAPEMRTDGLAKGIGQGRFPAKAKLMVQLVH